MKRMANKLMPLLLAVAAVAGMASCEKNKFTVEGNIANAQDSVLYFEHVSLAGPVALDSARLGADGHFSFRQPATEAPEFYRLRISDQIINVAVDSTETIGIQAKYPGMASDYEVTGSDNCQKIKELAVKQLVLHQQALALEANNELSADAVRDSLTSLLNAYKEEVKRDYIFREPNKSYAYFALFQTLGPWLIFNPRSNKDDVKVYAAVATSWDTYYPGAERGQNLHNIAIEGMKNIRIAEAKSQQVLDAGKVVEAGLIDIALTDNKGQLRRLSELKGKVVLLDFHVFAMEDSPKRILMLRELYNKYHAQGLEIYQVSLDANEHFWKQATAALPWLSVRDPEGLSSETLLYYNVPSVPEFFLIDRNNSLVKRSGQMKDLDAEIKRLL